MLEAIAGANTTRYLYGVGLIGEQTNSWGYDLVDGTNTSRQWVDAEAQVTFAARYTPCPKPEVHRVGGAARHAGKPRYRQFQLRLPGWADGWCHRSMFGVHTAKVQQTR